MVIGTITRESVLSVSVITVLILAHVTSHHNIGLEERHYGTSSELISHLPAM